jgi:hypothetical protein
MEDSQRDAIVDDLLTLRPKGLEGVVVVYEDESYFCHSAYKYKNRVKCNHAWWGYDPDTLFSLGFRSKGGVEEYIAKRFFDKHHYQLKRGEKSSSSRRVNRLWSRIEEGVSQVLTEGRPGIYTITKRWGSSAYATVWAESHDQAQDMGKMFYNHVLPEGESLRTNFVRIGDQEEVIPVNVQAVKDLESEIESSERRIKRYQDDIDDARARIAAIQMMQSHMLAAAASRAEQE